MTEQTTTIVQYVGDKKIAVAVCKAISVDDEILNVYYTKDTGMAALSGYNVKVLVAGDKSVDPGLTVAKGIRSFIRGFRAGYQASKK